MVLLSRADPRLEGRWGGEGCVIRKYLRKREFFGKTIDRWMMVERQDSSVGRSLKKVFCLSAAGPTRPGSNQPLLSFPAPITLISRQRHSHRAISDEFQVPLRSAFSY
jgi:hypothetical protein